MARKRIVKLYAINLLYNFIIARTFAEILDRNQERETGTVAM